MATPRQPGSSPEPPGPPRSGTPSGPRSGAPGGPPPGSPPGTTDPRTGRPQTARDPRSGRYTGVTPTGRQPAARQKQPVDIATRLDGQRGWLRELDQSLKKRSIIALVLTCLAVGVGAAALYISITKNADGDRISALETRISDLEEATEAAAAAGGATVPETGTTLPETGTTGTTIPETGTTSTVPPTGTTGTTTPQVVTPGE
ncbi:MAG: hypothetical protein M9938_06095 [Solirubrobacterales bacterium]|nr:hypothetical protein [Solirubrobacterales bacterium]